MERGERQEVKIEENIKYISQRTVISNGQSTLEMKQ